MKNKAKKILTILSISTVISTIAVAGGYTRTIEVIMNSIMVKVDGEYMSGDNILYKGTTYLPLRAVGESLGKSVIWDDKTKTANINDKPLKDIKSSFKVPSGVPKQANLVESNLEHKYHKFNYIVDLPSGGRITQVSMSKSPGKDPHIWIVGHDKDDISFIRGRSSQEAQLANMSYYSSTWAEHFTKEDEDVAYEEIRSFFKAYGYEDTGYNQWLKFTR